MELGKPAPNDTHYVCSEEAHLGNLEKKVRKGRPHQAPLATICRLRNKLHCVRSRLRKTQRDLADIKDGKQRQRKNRMTPELLAKVSLSWPTTCARGFAGAWQDLVGVYVW